MANHIKLSITVCIIVVLGLGKAKAQTGEIKDQVNVLGSYIPELKAKEKFSEQPVIADTFRTEIKSQYRIETSQIEFQYSPDTLSAARMKTEQAQKLKRFYAKLGFGNYLTPLAELRFNSIANKTDAYSLSYNYLSSAGIISNRAFPGMSDHDANAKYKHMFKHYLIMAQARYTNNQTHYYGYDPADSLASGLSKKDIQQTFNKIAVNVGFRNHNLNDSNRVITNASISYYYLGDRYNSREHGISLSEDISKYLKQFYLGMRIKGEYYNNRFLGGNAISSGLIHLNPNVRLGKKKWNVEAGAIATLGFDGATRFYIMPNIHFDFYVYKKYLMAFASGSGSVERQTYDRQRLLNPFIIQNPEIRNTYNIFDVFGGFRGSFSRDISYQVAGGYKYSNDVALFVTDTSRALGNYFKTIYDNMGVGRVNAEIAYRKEEFLAISLKGNYRFFNPASELKAWHNPNLDITLSGSYTFKNMLVFKLDVFYIGNQFAPNYTTTGVEVVKLKGLADINLGVEYRYNKMLSAFVNFNNMAAFRYNRWFNYPTQQFNLIGGLSIHF